MQPPIEIFGPLELVEVFDFFDGPRLFSCKDESGQLFLAVWVDSSPTTDTWMCVAVSEDRYAALEADEIDLRSAFADAQDGTCLVVTTPRGADPHPTVERIACDALPPEWLPDPGEYLNPTA